MNYEPDQDFELDERPVSSSWHQSVTSDLEQSNKRAWMVATAAGVIAVLLAIALVILLPLKEREPYTLLVDRQTGNVEALSPTGTSQVTPDESLVRSFLVQYVTARESYAAANLQDDYRKVSLFSAPDVRKEYAAQMDADNPSSPIARLPRGAVVRTEVKSVSPLDDKEALVRFTTTRTNGGFFGSTPQHWVAVIRYRFTNAEMSEADRFVNPLGFQVTSYRRDAETLPGDTVTDSLGDAPPIMDFPPAITSGPPDATPSEAPQDGERGGETAETPPAAEVQ